MNTTRYLRNVRVIGDGAKYILLDGEYIPWVSSNRTGRLYHDDIVEWAVVKDGYVNFYESNPRYTLPNGAKWEEAQ